MPPLRIVIADDSPEVCAILTDQLAALGHTVLAQAATGRDAVRYTTAERPDVVLLDIHMPDGSGVDAALEIAREAPGVGVVLFTGDEDYTLTTADATATSAVCFLPKPSPRALLESTIRLAVARARELAAARHDAGAARRQLEDRKVIERAKGILMRRTGASEQEAYRILQRSSQDRAVPMVKIAQTVLDSEPSADARAASRGAPRAVQQG